MDIIEYSKARFEKNRLIIDDGTCKADWELLGEKLKTAHGSLLFWVGDWARFGEKQGFAGKNVSSAIYDELVAATGYSRQTIQDAKYVAEATSSLRNEDLSFNHHKVVAPLPAQQQKKLLDQAANEKLSVRKLRERVNESHQPEPTCLPAAEVPAPVAPVTPVRELSFGHYRLIDDLPDHLKEMITQKILAENMSVEDLKKEMECSAPPRKFDLTHIRRIQNQDEWEDILRGLVYHINIYCTDDQRGYLLENISI